MQDKTGGRVTGAGKDRWQGYWYRIRQVAGLLVQEKTDGRVTGRGKDRWQGYWYRKRQVLGLLVTGTGKDK